MKNILNKAINIAISVISLVLVFIAFEIGTRIYFREYRTANFLDEETTFLRSKYPMEYHSKLGWISKVGNFNIVTDNPHSKESKSTITILEDGIRANGKKVVNTTNELILTTGDSFTYGAGVSDNETWPSILEELSGIRVINGGVSGYGIDQSFLRMISLAAKYKPDIIVFSFIPDDIYRCEFSNRFAKKPYYNVSEDGKLMLNDKHVSSIKTVARIESRYKRKLGYSLFIHKLMMEKFKGYWLQDVNSQENQIHSKGEEVVCLIFNEIKNYIFSFNISNAILNPPIAADNNFQELRM